MAKTGRAVMAFSVLVTAIGLVAATLGLFRENAVAAGQTAGPAKVPDALRNHVTNERFQSVTSIRGLPLGVRDELQNLFGSGSLDIAEPGAPFQVTDVIVNAKLPRRRLIAAGCSADHCLVYYERGGIAHTWHVTLFHWTPAATRLEMGGVAPSGLKSIEEIRTALLSDRIKGSGSW